MFSYRNIIKAGIFLAGIFLFGCAPSTENLKLREAYVDLPETYPTGSASENTLGHTKPVKAADEISAKVDWKKFFKDDSLVKLIDEALKKNQELAIVEQEINVAKNEIMSREGEYLPKLGLKAGGGVERVGKYTSQGVSDDANNVKKDLPNLSLGFAASWELDIWGKLRNATKSALYKYFASIEGKNFITTRLVAEISSAYYELRALHKKVEILEQNIELQKQALEMMRLQKQAARVTELAVKRFEAEVFKNQSRKYELKQKIVEKENEINFLAGRFPTSITVDSDDFINQTPEAIQAGIPSKLLENRPDVKQAEMELKSAKLNVDVARARFYPAFSIEAGAGFQSFNANHLFDYPGSLFYNLAANVTAPLLNRQGIKADYFSAGSKQLQAVYGFERTILKAYTEVANQLNKAENLKRTFQLKSQQVEELNKSISISNTLFQAARCDYMEVLLTRRDALEAQMELAEVKQQQFSTVVNLYQSLGGGWRSETSGDGG